MTLAEIETLLKQLQTQVAANTAAIKTLNNTIANYATDDDLSAIANKVNTLQNNNTLLQDSVAALSSKIEKITHIDSLLGVSINSLTTNDILQYGSDGKWHNIQPSALGISGGTSSGGVTSLSALSDVYISGVSNGQALVYSSLNNKWTNGTVSSGSSGGSVDMSNYLTIADAQKTYLPLSGGTVQWLSITNTLTTGNDATIGGNLLVAKGVTMYNS